MNKDPAGRLANRSGKDMERDVAELLDNYEFAELDKAQKKLLHDNEGVMPHLKGRWFAQQVRLYRTLYNSRHTTDFILWAPELSAPHLLEIKWQESQGSVDEKYVFTALSLKDMPVPAILVLEGGGARSAAVKWLRKQNRKGKFELMTYHMFERWLKGL